MLLLLLPSVYALEYRDVCSSNITLKKFMNFTACENVTCVNYNFTQNIDCPYGCDTTTNVCNQSPISQYLLVGVIIMLLVFVVVVLVKVATK
jgi:hypothetical protein